MSVLFRMRCVGLLVLLSGLFPAAGMAADASQGGFSIDASGEVVYCDAQWNGDLEALAEVLNAGIGVSMHWEISVARVRQYWLDKDIAEIEFDRSVRPDLLTRNWLLEDSASGIAWYTGSLSEAVAFLTRIDRFPVLDRSLLEPGALYVLSIAIDKRESGMDDTWWSRFWKQSSLEMQQEFSLP